MTSLHDAITSQNVDTVRLILKNGADADTVHPLGGTTLIMAVKSNNIEIVKLVFMEDVDIFEKWHERTALSFAKSDEVKSFLKDKGVEQKLHKSTKISVPRSGERCTICTEELPLGRTATKLPCAHLFHRSCIESWLRTAEEIQTCPNCRGGLTRLAPRIW